MKSNNLILPWERDGRKGPFSSRLISAALIAWLVFASSCQSSDRGRLPAQTLRVFAAGSLIYPFAELEKTFEAAHPGVDVQMEFHGSIQVMRHVTDLHEPIDVVATADHVLIPMLMYATRDPDTDRPYAGWYIRFAGNRMALAYTDKSRYADTIAAENWYELLTRPGVTLGLPDPRFDAAGYRAMMVLTLAEKEYGVKGLFDRLIKNSFTWPLTRYREEGYAEISIPEILEPVEASNIVLRGSSIQLLAVLEAGDVDYAFEYESVIAQHDLLNISLPEPINLGLQDYADRYGEVEVKLDFQRFASVKPVFVGEPIGYGITIPSNAPEPELAEQFIAFLLSPAGKSVMESAHHPLLASIQCDHIDQVPALLLEYCQEGS